jgi:hypothetical protein
MIKYGFRDNRNAVESTKPRVAASATLGTANKPFCATLTGLRVALARVTNLVASANVLM